MPTGEIEVVIEDILDVAAPKRRFEVSPRVLVKLCYLQVLKMYV